MKSSTNHYCSCNPKSKPDREAAKWYCYRHRRHLCDNCIYDELNQRHISCFVGTYDEFIQSPPTSYSQYKKNKCPICDKLLPDDDARSVVRLNCACVYHTNCLQQYLLSNTSNNIPCSKCNILITKKSNKRSNLGDSVDNFLRSVSRQRLWNKPKSTVIASNDDEKEKKEKKEKKDKKDIKIAPKPHHTGHIVLDTREMTRHRTVKTSLNKDGNREDDKYNKPQRRKKSNINKFGKKQGIKTWFTTRKTLVILLLCCAFIAQCWFLYMVFIKKNINNNQNQQNQQNQHKEEENINPDQMIRAKQGNIEGMIHNLPPNLKHEILGNKLKMQNFKKRLID